MPVPLVTAQQFRLTPDILGNVSEGLQIRGQVDKQRQASQLADTNAQIRALTGQAMQGDQQAFQQLAAISPETAQQVQGIQQGQVKGIGAREQAILKSITQAATQIQSLPDDQSKLAALGRRKAELERNNIPTAETQEVIDLFESGQSEAANALLDKTIQVGERLGFVKPQKGTGGLASAKTEILESGAVIQALPDGSVQVRDPSGKVVTGQARLDVLKQSKQQALQTLQAKTDIGVEAEGRKAEEKLKRQLALKPQIEAAVSKARAIATDKGEAFTELNQMQAALPSLRSTVDSLRELAPIATSTLGGRVFNTVVKEAGFGATKGATARAKFIAIVNNQVLPLLKPTFGAAFTVQEGEALKATLGDPNASPDEKMAQLDAFIEQKVRNIEAKQTQLQPETQQTPVDLTTIPDEELLQMQQQMQAQ